MLYCAKCGIRHAYYFLNEWIENDILGYLCSECNREFERIIAIRKKIL